MRQSECRVWVIFNRGKITMKRCILTVAAACVFLNTPGSVHAADLTIWWDEGYYPEEDSAVEAVIAAFEQKTGKDVELVFYPQEELPIKIDSAIESGHLPDLAYGFQLFTEEWANADALADVTDVVEPFKDEFFPTVLQRAVLHNGRTGQKSYYGVPLGQAMTYIHVWKSLLDQAGIKLTDIPEEWEAFWSFWCDRVQPAVREATGRNDLYGVGLTLTADTADTMNNFWNFVSAEEADYVTPDGKLVIDDPVVRAKLVGVLDRFATIYASGCTPPESASWANPDNNRQFHDQKIVMTINQTLSVTSALRDDRPDDYYKNIVTIGWPNGASGKLYSIETSIFRAVIPKNAANVGNAKEFLVFLLSEGRLGGFIEASLGRVLPPMPSLLESEFWQDDTDPHRTAAVRQMRERPVPYSYIAATGDLRHAEADPIWAMAVSRVAAEDSPPDKVADDAIAHIKKVLSQ
jgi:multiple sugar transport system substrate-binding protein